MGGWAARWAMQEASHSGEIDTNWCAGGCKPWQETENGRTRYAEIAKINMERKAAVCHVPDVR